MKKLKLPSANRGQHGQLKAGMLKVISQSSKYKKMNQQERDNLRYDRLQKVVAYAKENSPYYKKLYKNIGEDITLSELPPTNKLELMAHFDEWITDSSVTLASANEFMKNLDNIGRKLNNKYFVFTTSGSTGNPAVILCDKSTNNVMSGINILRAYARKKDMRALMMHGAKTIGIFATGGFYLGNSSVRSRLLKMPWKKKQFAVTSALLPLAQIVKELNEFQPAMLGGYPTIIELLIDEQKSGRLHISPVIIMTGGEYLSGDLRKRLSEAFNCYVQTSYSCTEGGSIACECTESHFHINDDWLIIEPVDKENNPIPDGVQSDKILLTNLSNYTQPFIRYEVADRVIMHHEPCLCGNTFPWITLEGRTDDVVSLYDNEKKIKIAPLAIYATLKEIHDIRQFQVLVHSDNQLELRLIPVEGCDKSKVYQAACERLSTFFLQHNIKNISYSLSGSEPAQHPKSGKFKHIINCCK